MFRLPAGASADGALELAQWFDALNEGLWDESLRRDCDVISFSHFLPHQVRLAARSDQGPPRPEPHLLWIRPPTRDMHGWRIGPGARTRSAAPGRAVAVHVTSHDVEPLCVF